jgi:hypothetical protein
VAKTEVGEQSLDKVLSGHAKRIQDLERRPIGCLDFHDHFYVVLSMLRELPPPDVYGGHGVGYLVLETGYVWAWTGGTWNDGPGRTIDDWLPGAGPLP